MTDSSDTRLDLTRCRIVQRIGGALALPTPTARSLIIGGDHSADVLAERKAGRVSSPATDKRLDFTEARIALRRLSVDASVAESLNAGRCGSNALDSTPGPQIVFQQAPAYPNAAPCAEFDSRNGTSSITRSDIDGTSAFSNNQKSQHA